MKNCAKDHPWANKLGLYPHPRAIIRQRDAIFQFSLADINFDPSLNFLNI